MNWIKKHPELKTIEEVVLKNTGYSSIKELDAVGKTYWIARLDDVVNTIKQYNGKVYIRGDYDCDGICATAILHIALDALGYPTDIHLPHRFTEGYGLSEKMINDIPDGNHLLITVDNGITAVDSIKLAKEKGKLLLLLTTIFEEMTDLFLMRILSLTLMLFPELLISTDIAVQVLLLKLQKSFLKEQLCMI